MQEGQKKKDKKNVSAPIIHGVMPQVVIPKVIEPSSSLITPELEKKLQQSREAMRREQDERDAVQEGIFGELQHLAEVQEQQQKSIDDVAASTAALATSSDELYPWQKWGTLIIILLSVSSIIIALIVGIRAGFI